MKKKSNKNLHSAKIAKKDEFYTQLKDIEKELWYYKEHFKNKVIYCNCDDPFESNFFKYFAANFNTFKLKKLIATCYSGSPIVGGQLPLFDIKGLWGKREPFKIEINKVEDFNKDGAVDLSDVEWLLKNKKNITTPLEQGGDFRSNECIELLKQADIVVTNPPFSLFREYIAQLMEYNKKFLIIGNDNAITYKGIFKLIKENKIWLGFGRAKEFYKPDGSIQKFGNVGWFTNLKHKKRNEYLILYKKYNKKDYPKYDNYDAIEVSKVSNIPMDYEGVMGVPINFLDKHNPEQLEIIGMAEDNGKGFSGGIWDGKNPHCVINGQNKFKRLFIKHKKLK